MINPDDLLGNCKLAHFADWFLKSGGIKDVDAPSDKNTLLFIEGVHGITLYKKKPFQVQLFICQPNLNIPVHTHPNVDSYEVFLYGMSFKKCGVAQEESLEKVNAQPISAHQAIRVRPTDSHGGVASEYGGAFISIQHWLNDYEPTHVSNNWHGKSMGTEHAKQYGAVALPNSKAWKDAQLPKQ